MRISKSCHLRFYEPCSRCLGNTSKVPAHSCDQTKAAEEERLVIELPWCCLFHNLLTVAPDLPDLLTPSCRKTRYDSSCKKLYDISTKYIYIYVKMSVSRTTQLQSCHLIFVIIITHNFLIALIHPWLLWNNIYRNVNRHMTFLISMEACNHITK